VLILGGNQLAGGYDVANSLRFENTSTDGLTRTISSSGNRRTWTWSGWVKRSKLTNTTGDPQILFNTGENTFGILDYNTLRFNTDDTFLIAGVYNDGANTAYALTTNALYRDVSAWYHVVVAFDSTQGTSSDRIKLYVNGSQVTSFSSTTYPSLNYDSFVNFVTRPYYGIGDRINSSGQLFAGYMAEVVFIDGQALDPTSFGEFDADTGIWKPISVSGLTFGTNGFYLDFENSGSLGADVSGNGNNFTVNNLTSIDQTTDTPTNNFCTANPLHTGSGSVSNAPLSDGNLTFTSSQAGSPYPYYFSTFAASQGKWYAEFKVTTANSAVIGIGTGAATGFLGAGLYDYAYYYDGTFYNNGGNTGSQSSYTNGDIISVAMDLDNNKVYVAKNNTWQHSGDPSAGTGGYTITAPASQTGSTATGVYHIAYGDAGGGTPAIQGNFGNPPFTISSGNSDGDGYGNFEYAVPSGYYALNSKNLAEYG